MQCERILISMKVRLLLLLCVTVEVLCGTADVAVENTRCRIAGEADGVCRYFKECGPLFSLLKDNPSVANRNLVKTRICGMSSDGRPLVCCSATITTTTTTTTTTTRSDTRLGGGDDCETPKGEKGICTLHRSCDALSHITARSSPAEKKLLRDSFCSGSDGKFYVCCPSLTPEPSHLVNLSPNNRPCKDGVNRKDGTCVPFENCQKLVDILKKKPVSEDGFKQIRMNHCGLHDNKHYVCCSTEDPLDGTTTAATTPVKQKDANVQKVESAPTPEWLESLKEKLADENCYDLQDFIFGGTKTKIDEYPWTVLLEYSKPDGTMGLHCGGSLINDRYVLTAGHCVRGLSDGFELRNVRLGEWNTETNPDCSTDDKTHCSYYVTRKVSRVIIHPSFRNTHSYHNDIALLRLADTVPFTRFIKPACLPLDPSLWTANFTGRTFDVVGWGKTETSDRSSTKLRAQVPFVPEDQCRKEYRRQGRNIASTQICAGGEAGIDSCNGDSGGPLMKYSSDDDKSCWFLVGIVSFGSKDCGTYKVPGVYTKVSSFLEWIERNIE